MTLSRSSPRAKRRWALLVGAVAAMTLLLTGITLAVHDLKFELDGNVTTEGSTAFNTGTVDWASFFNASGTKLALPTGFTASAFTKDFVNTGTTFVTSDTTTFSTGSKDTLPITPGWQCNADSNVNSKIDIMNAYAAAYTAPGPGGDQIMYFALERNFNSGDGNVGFWFLQDKVGCVSGAGSTPFTGDHHDGDILVVSAFTNGGAVSSINAYRWNGGATGSLGATPVAAGVDCRNPATTAGDTTCATVNSGTISTPWLTSTKQGGVDHSLLISDFFEGGLNLTKSNLGGKCFNTFIGDTRSSQSLTATLFDYAPGTLGECTSTTVTTPSVTANTTIPANGTLSVTDSALVTVTGVSAFNGTVSFSLCGPFAAGTTTLCDSGGVAVGAPQAVTSSPSTIVSAAATITSAGRYCWRADFSGDVAVGVPSSSDSRATECFLITPRQPTLATTAGLSPVDFGNPVTDTAALSNTANQPGSGGPAGSTNGSISPATVGVAAGGSITFFLYGPDPATGTNCSTLATGFPAAGISVPVSGDGTYGPVSYTPLSPGVYHWVATYSGNLPNTLGTNHNTACNDTAEDVTVRQIPTQIKTRQSWEPNDTATISATTGNLAANGTVAFSLYDNGTCAGTAKYTETKTLIGGSPTEAVSTNNELFDITTLYPDAADSVVTYSWLVVYTPAAADFAHTGIQSSCNAEHFSITYTNDPGPGVALP